MSFTGNLGVTHGGIFIAYGYGTLGFKCDKPGACGDLSEAFIQSNIGCGSCRAYGACRGLTGKFVNTKFIHC
jgi:hypothetical protein